MLPAGTATRNPFRDFLSRGITGFPVLKKVMELGSGSIVNAAFSAGFGIYVSRILGPADKGILALIGGSASLLTMLFCFGVPHAASYYVRKKPLAAHAILRYMNLTQLAGAALCTGMVLLGQDTFSGLFLDGNHLDSFSLALVIGTIFGGLGNTMYGSCVIAKGESKSFATIGLAGVIFNIAACLLLLAVMPSKLHAVLASGLAGLALSTLLYRLKYSGFLPPAERLPLRWQEFFLYGSRVQVGSLSNLFFKRADLFIIGYFLDTRAVGFYSIGLGLRELCVIVPRALSGIVGGELADPLRKPDRKAALLKRSLLGAFVFAFALALGCTLVFPFLIPAFYSKAFAEAVTPSIILMWSFIPLSLSVILTSALISDGQPWPWSVGNVISAVLSGALVWALTRSFGLTGAAFASVAGGMIQLLVSGGIFLKYSTLPMAFRRARA